jgi:CHAT domain-containing protein/Tfp pilus assembly protein PilF
MKIILTLIFISIPLTCSAKWQVATQEPREPTSSRAAEIEEARRLSLEVEELIDRDGYDEALPKARLALEIRERVLRPDHPEVASALNNLAYILFRKKNYPKARELFSRALTIQEKTGFENREAVRLLNNVGLLYHAERDRDAAERFYRRALAMQEKLPRWFENPKAGFVIFNLAILLLDKGDHDGAEPLFRRALKVLEEAHGPESDKLVASLNYLAFIRLQGGNRDEALSLFNRALGLIDKHRLHDPVSLLVVGNLLFLYGQEGDHARTEGLARRTLAILEKDAGDNLYARGAAFFNVAQFYMGKGDRKNAELFYGRAGDALEKVPEQAAFAADVLTILGKLHVEQSELDKAKGPLERALALRQKVSLQGQESLATNLSLLAHVHHEHGNYREAESLYQRALDIYLKTPGELHPYTATVINNLGVISLARGDCAAAVAQFERALKIREQVLPPGHEDLAATLTPLAWCYKETRGLDESLRALQRSLKIYENSRDRRTPLVAKTLNDIGLIHIEKGEPDQAAPLFREALAINEEKLGKNHLDLTTILNNLALAREAVGDLSDALRLYERALGIYEKSGVRTHPALATILGNLSRASATQGNINRAVSLADRAANIEEHYLALMLTEGSERQNLSYWRTLLDSTERKISLHTANAPDNRFAAQLALTTILRRKGRVLDAMTDSVQALRARQVPEGQNLFTELSVARARLAARLSESSDGGGQGNDATDLARLEADYRKLEALVSGAGSQARSRPLTVRAVQKLLPAGAALVEFAVYRPYDPKHRLSKTPARMNRYVAYVLHRRGPVAGVDLGEAADIDCQLWDLRAALRNPNARPYGKDVATIAREVDEKVMRPVRRLLGGTRRVFISPDRLLQLTPFEALRDERGRYLVENYSFTYLNSGRDLQRLRAGAPNRQLPHIIANPDFNLGGRSAETSSAGATGSGPQLPATGRLTFTLLPETEEEANQIQQLLPGALVIKGAEATESALKQVRGPSVLHIATHGFFAATRPPNLGLTKVDGVETFKPCIRIMWFDFLPDWKNTNYLQLLSQSGIALAGANQPAGPNGEDGILTAFEAAGLDLQGTKLVVLSACETAMGDPDSGNGVLGLRRALAIAGSQSQVISLWRVNEEATRDLMINFYARMRAGRGRADALRDAKLNLLRSHNFGHPYFWASFIQSGDWRNLRGR